MNVLSALLHRLACAMTAHDMGDWHDIFSPFERLPTRFMRQCYRCDHIQHGVRGDGRVRPV